MLTKIKSSQELKDMLLDARNRTGCVSGTCQNCGCGIIHRELYTCKHHYNLLRNNTHIYFVPTVNN